MVVRLADRRSDGRHETVVIGFLVINDVFEHKHVKSALHLRRDYGTSDNPPSGITRLVPSKQGPRPSYITRGVDRSRVNQARFLLQIGPHIPKRRGVGAKYADGSKASDPLVVAHAPFI